MFSVSRIDSLMHEIGRRSVPFQLWGIWDFDKPLDEKLLRRSVECLLLRIPLLGCRLEKSFFRDRFVPIENLDLASLIRFERIPDESVLEEKTNRVVDSILDINTGPGLKVHCFACDKKTRLILHIHHIFADGRSTVNIMSELASLYTKLSLNPTYEPSSNVEVQRGLWQVVKRLKPKHWFLMGFCLFVEQILKSLVSPRNFEQLAMDKNPEITGKLGSARYATIEIAENSTERMQKWCKENGAKINDFLMTALIKTVHSWNRSKQAKKKKYIPMVFAADLRRRYAPNSGIVANLSTAHRFWIKQDKISDFTGTAKEVKAGLDAMKRRGLGLDGIAMILQGAWIPGAIGSVLFGSIFKNMANYMFRVTGLTNIGPIPDDTGKFGPDIEASRCSIIVPIFPSRNVLFAATTFKGRITLRMGYDGHGLSRGAANQFKKLVEQTIENALSSPSSQ